MNRKEKPRRSSWSRRLIPLVVALIGLAAWRAYMLAGTAQGQAPALRGPLLNGHGASVTEGPVDKPVLVHFWATWCDVCAAEQESIAAVAEDHPVVTVAIDSGDLPTVRSYLKKEQIDVPVFVDDGNIAAAYGVNAVPTSFIVGQNGEIRFTERGYTTELGLRLRLWAANWW